jgi:hypothetical protein
MPSYVWWVIGLGVLGFLVHMFLLNRAPNSMSHKIWYVASVVAQNARPDLTALGNFISQHADKLNAAAQDSPDGSGGSQIEYAILQQLMYIHDMLAIMSTSLTKEGEGIMELLMNIAYGPRGDWIRYTNTIKEALKHHNSLPLDLREQQRLNQLIRLLEESARFMMPVRTRLQEELRKAGVEVTVNGN